MNLLPDSRPFDAHLLEPVLKHFECYLAPPVLCGILGLLIVLLNREVRQMNESVL